MYNFVLMVGKSSLKSSHRMQSNAVLEGLGIGLQIWSWPNLCEKSLCQVFLLAKVLVSKTFCVVFGESYYLPRSIKAAPYFLSRREMKRTRQFGSRLLWANLMNNSCVLWSASPRPSSTNKTLDWFSVINLWKFDSDTSSISSGRTCSLMASRMSDLLSRHLSSSNRTIIGNDSSQFSWIVT